jgi:hypothetical protein
MKNASVFGRWRVLIVNNMLVKIIVMVMEFVLLKINAHVIKDLLGISAFSE